MLRDNNKLPISDTDVQPRVARAALGNSKTEFRLFFTASPTEILLLGPATSGEISLATSASAFVGQHSGTILVDQTWSSSIVDGRVTLDAPVYFLCRLWSW